MTRAASFTMATINMACCTELKPGQVILASDVPETQYAINVLELLDRDVVVAQEVLEWHVPYIARALGFPYFTFAPMNFLAESAGVRNRFGLAIFSKFEILKEERDYIGGFADDQPQMWHGWQDYGFEGTYLSSLLQVVAIRLPDGSTRRVGNIHFPWSMGGMFSPTQRSALERLMISPLLRQDLVWAGDMNLPRGQEGGGWEILEKEWFDNMPLELDSSLDLYTLPSEPPRPADLRRMIDAIWTPRHPSQYHVSNVSICGGASDHMVFAFTVNAPVRPRAPMPLRVPVRLDRLSVRTCPA